MDTILCAFFSASLKAEVSGSFLNIYLFGFFLFVAL
jgi:hypothetical protein